MRIENRLDLDFNLVVVSELIVLVDSWCAACVCYNPSYSVCRVPRARERAPRDTRDTARDRVSHTHRP